MNYNNINNNLFNLYSLNKQNMSNSLSQTSFNPNQINISFSTNNKLDSLNSNIESLSHLNNMINIIKSCDVLNPYADLIVDSLIKAYRQDENFSKNSNFNNDLLKTVNKLISNEGDRLRNFNENIIDNKMEKTPSTEENSLNSSTIQSPININSSLNEDFINLDNNTFIND